MLDRFLTENTTSMRLARTVVQGLIAAIVVFLPTAVGWLQLSAETATFMTAAIMAVLSPLMALIKKSDTIESEE